MPGDVIQRDPGAEHPGRGRPDRRPAVAARADARTRPSPPSRGSRRPSSSATSSSRPSPTARRCCSRTSRGSSSAARTTASLSRLNGHPGAGIAIQLAPGADALKTAEAGQGRGRRAAPRASRRASATPSRTTAPIFIKLSIHEVVKTLVEAILLVVLVMFVFLQSWRADPDPGDRRAGGAARHVRRARASSGFSINTLTLFGHGARRSACWSTTPSSSSRMSSG